MKGLVVLDELEPKTLIRGPLDSRRLFQLHYHAPPRVNRRFFYRVTWQLKLITRGNAVLPSIFFG